MILNYERENPKRRLHSPCQHIANINMKTSLFLVECEKYGMGLANPFWKAQSSCMIYFRKTQTKLRSFERIYGARDELMSDIV